MIGVAGSIQTRNYEKDGQRVYITEVSVDEVEPLSVNRTSNQTMSTAQGMPEDDVDFGAFAPADGDLPY
jgi:single-strand DNA-binding protein